MNEELRSSAEELETSKEELQSVNEELTTVNQELKIKIEELGLDQQRLPEPDQLDRHRHDLPRPRAAREAVHAARAATSSTCCPPTSAGRSSDITTGSRYDRLSTTSQQRPRTSCEPSSAKCQTRDGRWYPDAAPAVPDDRRPHRRRGADVPGHHRPAAGRGRLRRERGAAAAADRRRASTTRSSR